MWRKTLPRQPAQSATPRTPSGVAALAAVLLLFALCAAEFWITEPARAELGMGTEGDYLLGAIGLRQKLQDEPGLIGDLRLALNPGYIMTPGLPLAAQPLLWLGADTPQQLRLVNLAATLALLLALYGLGARLFDRSAGVLAALLAATAPSLTGLAGFFDQYVLAAAANCVALLLLLETERFRRLSLAVPAGLGLAVALLCHRGSPLFIFAPPVLVWFALGLKGPGRRRAFVGLALYLAAALLPAAGHLWGYYRTHLFNPDYFANLAIAWEQGLGQAWDFFSRTPLTEALNSALSHELSEGAASEADPWYHWRSLLNVQFGPALGWLWPPAALWLAWRGRRDNRLWLLLLTALLPPLWFGFFGTKIDYYIFQVTPLFALIMAGAATGLPRRRLRLAATSCLVGAALLCSWLPLAMTFSILGRQRLDYSLTAPWRVGFMPDFDTPGLGRACRDQLDLLSGLSDADTAVLYVGFDEHWDQFNLDSVSLTRDLLACTNLARPDLAAAQAVLQQRPPDPGVMAEVWVYTRDDAGFEAARELGRRQRLAEPGQPIGNAATAPPDAPLGAVIHYPSGPPPHPWSIAVRGLGPRG